MKKLSVDAMEEQDEKLVLSISTMPIREDAQVWVENGLGDAYPAILAERCSHNAKWKAVIPLQCEQAYVVNGKDSESLVRSGRIVKEHEKWVNTQTLVDYDVDIISVSVTDRCNMNCNMCWKAKAKKENLRSMSFDDFQKILDKIAFLAPAKVFLWGGEPLLNPDLFMIIRALKKRHFMCYVVTNGLLLSNYADELIDSGVDSVCVSLDGINEVQDQIRGVSGSFAQIEKGLRLLSDKKKLRPVLSTNTVINALNYRTLYQIAEKFSDFGINSMQFQFPVSYRKEKGYASRKKLAELLGVTFESWKGFTDSAYSFDPHLLDMEIKRIRKDFPQSHIYPNTTAAEWFRKEDRAITPRSKCMVPWKRINIEPNGDMTLCPDYGDMAAGNLFKDSLEKLWNGEKYQCFRQLIEEKGLPICSYCTYSFL